MSNPESLKTVKTPISFIFSQTSGGSDTNTLESQIQREPELHSADIGSSWAKRRKAMEVQIGNYKEEISQASWALA